MPKRARSQSSAASSTSSGYRGSTPSFPTLEGQGSLPQAVEGDGACLFRAVSYCLYGTQARHLELRRLTVSHMKTHAHDYAPFCVEESLTRRCRARRHDTEAFDLVELLNKHLSRMALPTTFAGEPEIQALATCLNLDITIHRSDGGLPNVIYGTEGDNKQVDICFHVEGQHYWATEQGQQGSLTPDSNEEEGRAIKKPKVMAHATASRVHMSIEKVQEMAGKPEPAIVDWSAKMGIDFDDED